MKFKYLIFFIFFISCTTNYSGQLNKQTFTSKGFAYIYDEKDFLNKLIKKKIDNSSTIIAHNSLRKGTLLNITNPRTKKSIKLKTNYKIDYPNFYKILLSKKASDLLELEEDFPYIEVEIIKKNKSFIAKKANTHIDETKIHANAPVTKVKISNISKQKKNTTNKKKKSFSIIIGDFYSKETALFLKERLIKDLDNIDEKKLKISIINKKSVKLLSGPYNSVEMLKNDYISLNNFGFEDLDIKLND